MSLEKYFSEIRAEFPAVEQKMNGHDLIYLDTAATSLKPRAVIDRIHKYYSFENANVHRGAHTLSNHATTMYEDSRQTVARFLGAQSENIIFVRGTTEGINLISDSFGSMVINEADEILITTLEHHANIVPWQVLAQKKKAILKVVGILENGELDLNDFRKKLNSRTKIFSFTACSNTFGTVLPAFDLIQEAKKFGAYTVVDGAQIVSQRRIDLEKLGCDFFVFSGHKLFGPTGIGVVYGKKQHLEQMPPYQTGGSMISEVTFEKTSYNIAPLKFEAGTPHIEGAIGLKAAIDFFQQIDISKIHQFETEMTMAVKEKILKISGAHIFSQAKDFGPIVGFNIKGVHHSDLAQMLDQQGIAIRAGHMCTQPLLAKCGITGLARISVSIYNQYFEIEKLSLAMEKTVRILS